MTARARSWLVPVILGVIAGAAWGCGQPAGTDTRQAQQDVRQALHAYFDAYVAQNRESLRQLTTDDFELIENGYPMDFARFTETMDVKDPGTEKYAFDDLRVEVAGDIAQFQYRLTWRAGDKTTFTGIETGFARRLKGSWRLARFHGTWLARRASITPDQLAEYTGTYGESTNSYHIVLERSALYAERVDRKAWSADVRRAELIPIGHDEFVLEFDETPIHFERGAAGRVVAVGLPAMEGSGTTRFSRSAK